MNANPWAQQWVGDVMEMLEGDDEGLHDPELQEKIKNVTKEKLKTFLRYETHREARERMRNRDRAAGREQIEGQQMTTTENDNDEKKSDSKRQKRKEISPLKPVKTEDMAMSV